MKIFVNTIDAITKVNFVDENNVFVGYSLDKQCCETFGWFIADEIMLQIDMENFPPSNSVNEKDVKNGIFDFPGWNLDRFFFLKFYDASNVCKNFNLLVFRMLNQSGEHKYIHLVNVHNGSYGHGFIFGAGKNVFESGTI